MDISSQQRAWSEILMYVSTEERPDEVTGGGRGESSPASSGPRSAGGPSPRPTRRSFSPEYKLAIVAEYEAAPNGEKVRSCAGRACIRRM